MNSVFLLNCYYRIKDVSPQGKRKSSKDSIKDFWWRYSWKDGQLPRSCGIVVLLTGSLLLCCVFLTPWSPLGCQAHSCSLWDRMFLHVYYWRNECTVLKHWEFSGCPWKMSHICIQVLHTYSTVISYLWNISINKATYSEHPWGITVTCMSLSLQEQKSSKKLSIDMASYILSDS